MLTPFGYFDLLDAMIETGCPICHLLQRDAAKLLNTILYEYVTEPEMHAIFRASRGLCNVHAWQLTEQGNVMSIAVLYSAVVDEVVKAIQQSDPTQPRLRSLFKTGKNGTADALDTHEACPACAKLEENTNRYVEVFADKLDDGRLMAAFETSDGLCLEHFKRVIRRNHTSVFIEIQRAKWRHIYDDMQEFIRKYDPTKAESAMDAEGDSWLRAVRQMVGERGIFGTRDD